jgi:energy-coupling factor transport system ATP-binding protein
VIELRQAGFQYPAARSPAFEIDTLDVQPGQAAALVGSSGSGKTSLLRLLAGIAPNLTGGTAWGTGRLAKRLLPSSSGDLADIAGYLPQDPLNGVVCDRVEDEIVFTVENLGLDSAQIGSRLANLLGVLNLESLRRRRISTLSGGERQKVQLASALIAHPDVLLLDEPTSQLDAHATEALQQILHQVKESTSILVVEQRPDRLGDSIDHVIRMDLPNSPIEFTKSSRAPGDLVLRIDSLEAELGGAPILRNVTFDAREGEVVALKGDNGSGKTTLLRAILGFVRSTSGRVNKPSLDAIAYLPQRAESIFCRETVRDEVVLSLKAKKQRSDTVEQVLSEFGLESLADCSPRKVSAGQKLRIACAAISAGNPRLVLLDEPTRGLDSSGRRILYSQIQRWQRHGAAVLIATHDQELAEVCSRTVTLRAGEISHEVLA